MYWSAFHYCDKYLRKISVIIENIYFSSWFQMFQSLIGWSVVFGLLVRRASWQEHEVQETAHPMEARRHRERGGKNWGTNTVPFQSPNDFTSPH